MLQPLFRWRGFNADAHPLHGQMRAPSEVVVRHHLASQGIRVTHCERTRRSSKQRAITPVQWVAVITQLASLMKSGIPLTQALRFVSDGQSDHVLRDHLEYMVAKVEAGYPFHVALAGETAASPSLIQLIKAGELSGHLEAVLEQLGDHLQANRELMQRLRSALNYPLVVGGVAVCVVVLVLTQVVPVFEEAFTQMGGQLPLPTQWLIAISHSISAYGPLTMVLLTLAVRVGRLVWHQWGAMQSAMLHLGLWGPIWGPMWLLACQQRFVSTLALLIDAGIPLTDGLVLAGEAADHPAFQRAGQFIQDGVKQGQSLAESMSACQLQLAGYRKSLFPDLLIHLVKLGEASGQLDVMIKGWANDAQTRLRAQLLRMTDWLEPALMVFMGVVVGGLVVALYLPLFQMGQHV